MKKMTLASNTESPAFALGSPFEDDLDTQNFLVLKDDFLANAKFEAMYTSKNTKALSSEFKLQLASFFGVFWLCIFANYTAQLISFALSQTHRDWMIARTVFEFSLFFLSLLLLKRILRRGFFFKHHQPAISVLFGLYSTYLLIGGHLLCSDRTSLVLVFVLFLSLRSVVFSSFVHTLCVSFYLIVLFLVVIILEGKPTKQWPNLLFLTIGLLKQMSDAYVITYRTNKLFLKNRNIKKNTQHDLNSNQVFSESLSVISTLKLLKNTIIDMKVKEQIKDSLQYVRKMSMTLNSKMSLTLNFANLDEDERLFINQYCLKEQPEKLNNDVFSSRFPLQPPEGVMQKFGNDWSFDALFLSKITPNAIQAVGKYISDTLRIPSLLDVPHACLNSFHLEIDKGYNPMPYHNNSHACDVAHSVLFIVTKGGLNLGNLDLYSVLLAALAHDLGHHGVTNRFLTTTNHDVALMYNDLSVQENMHCNLLFKLVHKFGVFDKVASEDFKSIRKTMIEMILSTDMSKHFEQLGVFKMKIADLDMSSQADCILLYSIVLKCADIGHTAKPIELHQSWTLRVVEEFFNQGDLEKQQGLAVSMYCDREKTDLAKSQYGFINNIAYPLFKALGSFLNSEAFEEACIKQLVVNKDFWVNGGGNRRNTVLDTDQHKEFALQTRKTT